MGMVEETVVKAKEALDVAAKKTSEIIAVQKLKVNAASLQSQMEKTYAAMGRLVYEQHTDGTDRGSAIAVLMEELDGMREEWESLKEQIAQAKGAKRCPSCGQSNPISFGYCGACGAALEESQD